MTAAAAPYVEWLILAAAQAEVAALQARMAALAFEGALVATVPLPDVLANRARLLVLIATNFLGVNTAAIAQTELEYVEMWAQDVAAMLGYYAGAQSTAQAMPNFSVPPAALGGGAPSADVADLAAMGTAPLNFASQFFQGLSLLGTAFASQLQSVFAALSPAVCVVAARAFVDAGCRIDHGRAGRSVPGNRDDDAYGDARPECRPDGSTRGGAVAGTSVGRCDRRTPQCAT